MGVGGVEIKVTIHSEVNPYFPFGEEMMMGTGLYDQGCLVPGGRDILMFWKQKGLYFLVETGERFDTTLRSLKDQRPVSLA